MNDQQENRIWDAITSIREQVSAMARKLDTMIASLAERCEYRKEVIDAVIVRVKTLEERQEVFEKQMMVLRMKERIISGVISSALTMTAGTILLWAFGKL
jgi:hypothetical protein